MKADLLLRCKSIWLSMLMVLLLLVLAGCIAPIAEPLQDGTVPAMATEPSQDAPELQYGDATQCSSLFDLNMERTRVVMEHNIFWTWHLNFMMPTPDGTGYSACLHFFWRHDNDAAFVGAEKYILTPCDVVDPQGDGIIDSQPEISPSSFLSETVNVQRMYFDGVTRVECDLDLGLYASAFADSTEFEKDIEAYQNALSGTSGMEGMLTEITEELNNLHDYSPTRYPSFSFGAAAANTGGGEVIGEQPLIFYEPIDCPAAAGCTSFALGHEMIDINAAILRAEIVDLEYIVNTSASCGSADGICMVLQSEEPWYYLMEYGRVTEDVEGQDECADSDLFGQAYLTFRARPMTVEEHWWHWCSIDIEPYIYTASPPGDLHVPPAYWTRNTKVHVGYNPDSQNFLKGYLYEVWFDPDGSGTRSRNPG